MATITVSVQSFLNAANNLSISIADTSTVSSLKTAINSAEGVNTAIMDLYLANTAIANASTLVSLGITNGTYIKSSNNIRSLSTREARQVAKLDLASLDRKASSNPRGIYDINLLPNPYNGNSADPDDGASILGEGRPWVSYVIPSGMDRNEPYNGSGGSNPTVPGADYKTAASRGVPAYSASGITFNDLSSSALTSISNTTAGLYRRKYVGKVISTYGQWSDYDAAWFADTSHGPISQAAYEVDTYVSFGYRSDLGAENNYTLEWKGYFVAPVTGNMRFFVDVDDDIMVWIGSSAYAPTKTNYLLAQSGGSRTGTNGITVVAGKYYPVRMAFVEHGGAEQFQLFANSSAGTTVYNGQDLTWAHNSATKGY